MVSSEPRKTLSWQQVAASLLLAIGCALVSLSFAWPRVAGGSAAWPKDQALRYQRAAANLHSLSHKYAQAAAQGDERAVRRELEQAHGEYSEVRSELDSAMARPKRLATIIRALGLVLAVVGAVAFYYSAQRASPSQ